VQYNKDDIARIEYNDKGRKDSVKENINKFLFIPKGGTGLEQGKEKLRGS